MKLQPFSDPKSLRSSLYENLSNKPEVPTAILAGHNLLTPQGTLSDITGIFPEFTWDLAWDIAKELRDALVHLRIFTTINDWKLLKQTSANDNTENHIRSNFWKSYKLPESEDPEKKKLLLPTKVLEGKEAEGVFSEIYLQKLFSRRRAKEKDFKVTMDYLFSSEENICDSTCHRDKCSSEIIILIPYLFNAGIRKIINFIPGECINPVFRANEIVKKGVKVILPESFTEMEVHNVFLNSVEPFEEEDLFQVKPINYSYHEVM